MSDVNVSISFDDYADIFRRRNWESGGMVQKSVDSDVLKYSDPYIPFDTGMMRNSGISSTVVGSGLVKWNTPYTRLQYYTNRGGRGLRGRLWFERMKADRLEDILKNAAAISGGEVKR